VFRFSLRVKITLLVTTIVAVASITLGQFAFRNMSDVLTNAAGIGALTAAASIADIVDPSLVDAGTRAPQHPAYDQTLTKLHRISSVSTLAIVRVLKISSDGHRVESLFEVPELSLPKYLDAGMTVHPGDPQDSLLLWKTEPGRMLWQFDDTPDQRHMVGWAPVMSEGRQVGLVLVGVDVTRISQALMTLLYAIVATCFAFILVSGLIAFKTASSFEKTAVTDGLMGIYNHKYFKQRLEQEVAKSHRYAQQTSLVMLDIDYFKKVNDTFGHATGDLVLKNLARWVVDSSRNTDVVARYGGEEIGIILTHTGLAGAQEFAERLRLKISQQVIKDPEEDAEFRVTVSVGVAQAEKGVSMLDLIKRADAALYYSKRTGRNRVTIYQEDILPAPEPQPKTGS
jgi:diguanylate cyclase (GGDEF)-like protein